MGYRNSWSSGCFRPFCRYFRGGTESLQEIEEGKKNLSSHKCIRIFLYGGSSRGSERGEGVKDAGAFFGWWLEYFGV
jgi:hypothetical protein